MTTIISDASRVVNTPAPSGRFILVPEELIFSDLSDAEFRVACAHLTHTRPGHTETWPAQETLAERLDRSVKSIRRAEAALIERGLIGTRRLRKDDGKLGSRVLDFSAVVVHRSKMSSDSRTSPPSARRAMGQKRPIKNQNNSVSVEEQQASAPVVAILTDLGVPETIAAALAPVALKAKRSQGEIEAIVREWRRQGERIKNIGGWFRRALEQGYQPSAGRETYERPQRIVRAPRAPDTPTMPAPPSIQPFAASGEEARARMRQFLGVRATA